MDNSNKQNPDNGFLLPITSTSLLRGRQSIRATFKLSGRAIDAISIVASHLGIKQKSLFDHLIEDIDSLQVIAREIEEDNFHKLQRVQKTYVISRKTLLCLEETSKDFNAPRDALVEYSIQRLLPLIREEQRRHKKRMKIFSDIQDYFKQGQQLLKETEDRLGNDDPIYEQLEHAMRAFYSSYGNIKTIIERGQRIEDF